MIGTMHLGAKCAGARSAGNPLATCDAAGAGNGLTDRLVRHSQRKRGETDRPILRGTAPALDPTVQKFEIRSWGVFCVRLWARRLISLKLLTSNNSLHEPRTLRRRFDQMRTLRVVLVRVAAVLIIVTLSLAGCVGGQSEAEQGSSQRPSGAPGEVSAAYVCSMHPEVTSPTPGSCPKCGMALVRK